MASLINPLERLQFEVTRAVNACCSKAKQAIMAPTKSHFKGDYTLFLFPIAKTEKEDIKVIGAKIGKALASANIIASYEIVGGFLNMVLPDKVWIMALNQIWQTNNFGRGKQKNKNVHIEYLSPNTNKPLHLGHVRNMCIGQALGRILRFAGYDVFESILVNDRGIHICKSMVTYMQEGKHQTPSQTQKKAIIS